MISEETKKKHHDLKEKIACVLSEKLTAEELKCLICKEAASVIKAVCKGEGFDVVREYEELHLAVKAYAEKCMSEEMACSAKEEAISKYLDMVNAAERHELHLKHDGEEDFHMDIPIISIMEFGGKRLHKL